jgi:hypothetical protein
LTWVCAVHFLLQKCPYMDDLYFRIHFYACETRVHVQDNSQ